MARLKSKKISKRTVSPSAKVSRSSNSSLASRLNVDMSDRRSTANLVLGALVLVVLAVLLFNFFSKSSSNNQDLGPAGQTQNTQTGDVSKDNLPGKYTVKEGDTLFLIAQNYYNDGYKFPELVKANKLADENTLQVGQVLEIPKLEQNALALASSSPSLSPQATTSPNTNSDQGTGGAVNQTIWGEKITSDTYTVQAGDWLSKIAGRSYGDVMQFQKIAQANNISNPDLIEVGTVLKIPR